MMPLPAWSHVTLNHMLVHRGPSVISGNDEGGEVEGQQTLVAEPPGESQVSSPPNPFKKTVYSLH